MRVQERERKTKIPTPGLGVWLGKPLLVFRNSSSSTQKGRLILTWLLLNIRWGQPCRPFSTRVVEEESLPLLSGRSSQWPDSDMAGGIEPGDGAAFTLHLTISLRECLQNQHVWTPLPPFRCRHCSLSHQPAFQTKATSHSRALSSLGEAGPHAATSPSRGVQAGLRVCLLLKCGGSQGRENGHYKNIPKRLCCSGWLVCASA